MTREEKIKAINALKISAPIMAVTQEKFKDYIQTLNQIMDWLEQEPRWIPVSERLPEDSGEYLVSVIDEYNENQHYYKAVGVAWFAHKKDYDIKESEWRELGIDETVIAWMPLPTPYEPQESEG